MPRKACAFYARRKLANACEDRQTSKMIRRSLFVQLARHHAMKFIEERLSFPFGLALNALRHHARRSLRDSAARAFKANVLDDAILHLHVNRELIAAQRVVAFGSTIRRLKLTKVSRLLVVI